MAPIEEERKSESGDSSAEEEEEDHTTKSSAEGFAKSLSAIENSAVLRQRCYSDNDDMLVKSAKKIADEKSKLCAEVQDCIRLILENNEDDKAKVGLQILRNSASNVVTHPGDEAYKLLKRHGRTFQDKLFSLKPDGVVLRLIEAIGYVVQDSDYFVF